MIIYIIKSQLHNLRGISMQRAFNFNAGPSALPLEVLQIAQAEFLNYNGTGMSVMELSHRSNEYDKVHQRAKTSFKELLQISDDYEVLFLQGGASLQFSMLPLNLLAKDKTAAYILTGEWSEKAFKEAKKLGHAKVIASSQEENYTYIPSHANLSLSSQTAYLHITSNNTIYGTQWHSYPELVDIPLIADMSSDILSKKVNIDQFSLIYAGAQKNLGPAGVTVVIIKKELLTKIPEHIPTFLNYGTHVKQNSLYNTPPTFSIYIFALVLDWVKNQGGLDAIETRNKEKASLIYQCIDKSDGFYTPHAKQDSRSNMNITFTLPTEELTNCFLSQAKENGFSGLNGHRSIGGCRASIYNAVPLESCQALVKFMEKFRQIN